MARLSDHQPGCTKSHRYNNKLRFIVPYAGETRILTTRLVPDKIKRICWEKYLPPCKMKE